MTCDYSTFWGACLAKMLFSGSSKNRASAREQNTLGLVSFSTSINSNFQHSLLLYITSPSAEPSLLCSTGVSVQLPGFCAISGHFTPFDLKGKHKMTLTSPFQSYLASLGLK